MILRDAHHQDKALIDRIYNDAFPRGEGESVSKIALDLLDEKTSPVTISLVAEVNNVVVAHVAFSPVQIEQFSDCSAYILTPLAVQPQYQNRHIGSALIEHGTNILAKRDINYVFVYGDPKYYNRFGFSEEIAKTFIVPYTLQYPFGWLGRILNPYNTVLKPTGVRFVSTLSDSSIW